MRYAEENNISLGHFRNFTLSYSSNIPRQRGLSGSSAIACAALNCLISFFKLINTDIPVSHRPSLILAAEQDLGITAGLQDRIVQVYGGLIYMDFSDTMENRNNDHSLKEQNLSRIIGENSIGEDKKRKCTSLKPLPRCLSLDPQVLPELMYLLYAETDSGKCSGDIHGNFKKRWDQQQNNELRVYMNEIADLAEEGKDILCRLASHCKNEVSEETQVLKSKESKAELIPRDEYKELGALIRRNFQLRRLLFGDNVLGNETLHMVSIADSVGAPAKLTGSGGAVLALCFNQNQASELARACDKEGIKCEKVILGAILNTFY